MVSLEPVREPVTQSAVEALEQGQRPLVNADELSGDDARRFLNALESQEGAVERRIYLRESLETFTADFSPESANSLFS